MCCFETSEAAAGGRRDCREDGQSIGMLSLNEAYVGNTAVHGAMFEVVLRERSAARRPLRNVRYLFLM